MRSLTVGTAMSNRRHTVTLALHVYVIMIVDTYLDQSKLHDKAGTSSRALFVQYPVR